VLRSPLRAGFTIVELLVSLVVLIMVSLILVQITNSTASTWRSTTAKVEQFRSAGDAFEDLSRRISQATLNTFWDYDNQETPRRYMRQSELRFISGQGKNLVTNGVSNHPSHSIFFQAPLGYVGDRQQFGGLENLLNTWGYYVEFDKEKRPAFLDSIPNPPKQRYRYRLMEMMQPSENLDIYTHTSGKASNAPKYNGKEWFTDGLQSATPPVRALAENVIAMIILPKYSKKQDPSGTKLSPDYVYDSSPHTTTGKQDYSENQLPPVVQITLVAIDEVSANRIANGSTPPAFDSTLASLFQDASQYDADMKTLQDSLTKAKINFRVFTTNVGIRGARWSKE